MQLDLFPVNDAGVLRENPPADAPTSAEVIDIRGHIGQRLWREICDHHYCGVVRRFEAVIIPFSRAKQAAPSKRRDSYPSRGHASPAVNVSEAERMAGGAA